MRGKQPLGFNSRAFFTRTLGLLLLRLFYCAVVEQPLNALFLQTDLGAGSGGSVSKTMIGPSSTGNSPPGSAEKNRQNQSPAVATSGTGLFSFHARQTPTKRALFTDDDAQTTVRNKDSYFYNIAPQLWI